MTYEDCFKTFFTLKKAYTSHKYQVYNDIYHWPKIWSSTVEYGPIYHLDYSENLSQMHKFKPQSSHFNEPQYSLHCIIKYMTDELDMPYSYIYNLSDDMKHDNAFTATVVDHILDLSDIPETTQFKSDNCTTQYKCKWVFQFRQN